MHLNADEQNELAAFPAALLELIQAELTAGNSIVEIGHSFPAPPSGAYIKFANVVSTRARADGNGLSFRARNSAISSGEFTDADRRYFVVDPPLDEQDAARQEPDKNVIRREPEQKSDAKPQVHKRQAHVAAAPSRHRVPADHAYLTENSPTGDVQLLHFRDTRPFQEVQFILERKLVTLFSGELLNDKLCMHADADVNGAIYKYDLCFEAALSSTNCYSFRAEGSWGKFGAEHDTYFRKTSLSWFKYWTSDLTPANPPKNNENFADLYARVSVAALHAEAHLDSVTAIQQAIVAGVKAGGKYVTSHKEGGTTISWTRDTFVSESYGDDPSFETYKDEHSFLKMLQNFCQAEIMRHAVNNARSDVELWKLVWRRMHGASSTVK